MMLDMKHTFDALVIEHAKSEAQRERIFANPLYRYVSTSLAGTQEYMAMEKLHAVRADPRFDFIVLDTPPTTNALDFLDAPQKLVGAIDSPVMRWFVEQLEARRGLSLLGKGAAFVLRGLSRFTGAAFLEQVGEFITGINELFGGFRDRAKAVYDGLRQADVAFVIVTSPSPVTVAEAMFFHDKLGAYGIEPSAVIVNRVHVATRRFEQVSSEALARVVPAGVDAADLHVRMQRAASDLAQLAERDAEGIRRMRQHLGERLPHVIVPALDRDVHDLEALAQVGAHLRSAA
jgi:anion-transporting  ArsA/GET3 family ATPase